jgi:glucokinase
MADYAIGIDVGGTKIAAVLIDRAGQVIRQTRRPTTPAEGTAPVIQRIAACIRELDTLAPGTVTGVGVGIPGAVDSRGQRVIAAINLGWDNLPIGRLLVEALGSAWADRLWVDKDANAAAIGELLYGAGCGAQQLICVMVGTGVGAGLIFDGRLYHGVKGGDGNIGHLIVKPEGDLCACGKRGCIETIASGPAIARRAAKLRHESSTLALLNTETMTAAQVVTAAHVGDVVAQRILAEAGQALGIGLAFYIDLTNPERIIIGGGVSAAGDWLLNPLRQTLVDWALPINTRAVQVVPAALPDAGAIGAAAFVWMNRGN